jgi:RimJ/RimL family protein N-acetyltransferase
VTLDISPLDAADPEAMAAWYHVYDAASRHGLTFPTPLMAEELTPIFLADNPGEEVLAFSGRADGQVVSVGRIDLPLRDNLHLAAVAVHTLPEHRNRGYGSAMLAHLESVARHHGRRTVSSEAFLPYDGPADGRGHPAGDFLLYSGFTFALGDVVRVLDLPADEAMLERLAADAAGHHRGYTLRQFRNPVPDDIVDAFGGLVGSLVTEAPTGGRELEPEVFDAQRIRADEKILVDAGRTKFTTVAIAPDGNLVAYSEIAVPAHDPGRCYQWGTLVVRAHRGRRLGLATKARNLVLLQRERPDLRTLVTFNAEENQHMVAVNETLGFRPVQRLAEYEKRL